MAYVYFLVLSLIENSSSKSFLIENIFFCKMYVFLKNLN